MRRYGQWAGNPKGVAEQTDRCVFELFDRGWGMGHFRQCSRKRGHGPGGLFCKQHARMAADGKHLFVPEEKKEGE